MTQAQSTLVVQGEDSYDWLSARLKPFHCSCLLWIMHNSIDIAIGLQGCR